MVYCDQESRKLNRTTSISDAEEGSDGRAILDGTKG